MSGRKHCRGSSCSREEPGSASFLVSPGIVRVSEGTKQDVLSPIAVARSQVLTQAQRDAAVDGCRVPTSFTSEQISLWASYTRLPRVFMTQSRLLHILAVLEVADMLDDATSATNMCKAIACDYVAPLVPDLPLSEKNELEDTIELDEMPRGRRHTATAHLKARCKHPPPNLGIRHAFLWGTGLSLQGQLRGVGPAETHHCCRAAQASRGHRRSSAAAHSPQDKPDTVFKALDALPEPLLLRVLRTWNAPLATQLATLPRRLHPAAATAAHPSLDASRCISLGEHRPHTFRRALRAVAALGGMCRVDSVTLAPPCDGRAPDELRFAVHHLRHVLAITSLHLAQMPQEWLGSNHMHGLSCIAAMPHLRAVGFADVKLSLVPALIKTLSCMPQLHELDLGVCMVPLLADGGWGGASLIRQLTALTTLKAVKLSVRHRWLFEPGDDVVTGSVVPLVRDMQDKRVKLWEYRFSFKGKHHAPAVLGVLRAAAPQLDLAQCSVEARGAGSVEDLGRSALRALWGALIHGTSTAEGGHESKLRVGLARDADGMWRDDDTEAVFVPAGLLGEVPGLRKLSFSYEHGICRSSAVALTREMHKLTALTGLCMHECGLGSFEAAALLPRLSAVTTLQALRLTHNCIDGDGGEALAAGLPALGALTALELQCNDLGERGTQAVMAALAPAAAAGLVILNFHRNRIGTAGFAAVAARLPEMMSLRDLDLGAGVAGAEGIRAIHTSLASQRVRLTALTALDLERNFLECSGAAVLAASLPFLPHLAHLSLKCNAIGSGGVRALARGLMRMHTLVLTVGLSCNWFGDAGAQALARSIKRRAAMQLGGAASRARARVCYELDYCGIGDAGALALADAMQAWQAASGDGRESLTVSMMENDISTGVRDGIGHRIERSRMQSASVEFSHGRYRGDGGLLGMQHLMDV